MCKARFSSVLVLLTLGIAFFVPAFLGIFVVPLGVGPDEFAHIDHSFFRLTHPNQTIEVERGFSEPGKAPLCQGHQPGLSYWLNSKVLSLFHNRQDRIGFVDYLSGVTYSSEGGFFGGIGRCSYRDNLETHDPETGRFQLSIRLLRVLSALMFCLSGLAAYLLGRALFPDDRSFAISMLLFYLSIPNAIWRSIFVTNDNLPALFGAWVTLFGVMAIVAKPKKAVLFFFIGIMTAALAFLAKYTAIPLLAAMLIALMLNVSLSWKNKIILCLTGCLGYAAIVAPDLYENYRIDGDILSSRVIIHLANFLYHPTTHLNIIFDQFFLPTLVERIWVEYHKIGNTSQFFPMWTITIWWVLFILGTIGGVAILFTKQISCSQKRCVLFLFATSLLSFAAIVHLATTFPLPGGRYFHPALAALTATILIGLSCLWKSIGLTIPKSISGLMPTRSFVFGLSVISFTAGQALTFSFMSLRYMNCHIPTHFEEPAGATIYPIDIDGDGSDEIGFFYRIRNRMFFAHPDKNNHWSIDPSRTRYVGLVADIPFAADLNGDGKQDLLQWRPGNKSLTAYSADIFLRHNAKLSPYMDFAVTGGAWLVKSSFTNPRAVSSEPEAPRVDTLIISREKSQDQREGRGASLMLFNQEDRSWRKVWIELSDSNTIKAIPTAGTLYAPGTFDQPLSLLLAQKGYFGGFWKETGELHLSEIRHPTLSLSTKLPPADEVIVSDLDRDGTNELIGLNNNSRCLQVSKLLPRLEQLLSSSSEVCLPPNLPTLSPKVQLIGLNRDDFNLAIFERGSGLVWLVRLETNLTTTETTVAKYEMFNPGWVELP